MLSLTIGLVIQGVEGGFETRLREGVGAEWCGMVRGVWMARGGPGGSTGWEMWGLSFGKRGLGRMDSGMVGAFLLAGSYGFG